jgi:uncharacterized membrane protein
MYFNADCHHTRMSGVAMNMLFYLKLYVLTIPIFFIVDILWLGVIARGYYRQKLGFILSDKVNWAAASIFYLIYIAGILFFAVRPAIVTGSWRDAVVLGGLFGFFTYATYDLTNMATIKDWPLAIVVVDILWGVCLCIVVAYLSFLISRWLVSS